MRKTRSLYLTLCIYAMMLLYAISITLLGSLLPKITNDLCISLSRSSMLLSAQSAGGIIAIIFGGILSTRIPSSKIISFGFILYTVILLILGMFNSFYSIVLMFFLIGIGTRLVDTLSNGYITYLNPNTSKKQLNLLHVFFGLGAMGGPIIEKTLIAQFNMSWDGIFFTLGIACIPFAVIFLILTNGKNTSKVLSASSASSKTNVKDTLKQKKLIFYSLLMFLYFAFLFTVTMLFPEFLRLKYNRPFHSIVLTLFWAAVIAGRLINAYLKPSSDAIKQLKITSIASFIILTQAIVFDSYYNIVISIVVVGLLSGAYIPLLIAESCKDKAETAGLICSILFIFGYLATIIIVPFVGYLLESNLIIFGYSVLPVLFILFYVLTFFLKNEVNCGKNF